MSGTEGTLDDITVTATPIDAEPKFKPDPLAADQDLGLTIAGQQFVGWQEVRVTRGIERCPSDFDLGFTERYPSASPDDIKPGDPCKVEILGDLVLTGHIDRYTAIIDGNAHRISVAGRSNCADLVDSTAIFEDEQGQEQPTQLAAMTTRELVARLTRPFLIDVLAPDGDGPQVPQFNAMLTETPFEIIERICRHAQLLAYDDPQGRLILAKVGRQKHKSGFAEGVNVERAMVSRTMDNRFSEYDVILMPINLLGDVTAAAAGNAGWNLRRRVLDKGVGRRRRHVTIVEQMWGGEDLAIRRAQWEMARRYGRSQAVTLTTDSWCDSAGQLWQPNQKASLDLPSWKLTGVEWVISEVTYRRGPDGTHADLVLMPEEAFIPQPVILVPFNAQIAQDLAQSGEQPRP